MPGTDKDPSRWPLHLPLCSLPPVGVVPGARDKHAPGVWKLMRLISTGSLGWWGARSALFSRHLVRGSESFRLLCVSRQTEMCDPAVCDSASPQPRTDTCAKVGTTRFLLIPWARCHPSPSSASKGQDQFLPIRLTAPGSRQVRRRERRQVRAGWPSRACSMTVDGFLPLSEPWSPENGTKPFQLGSQPSKLGHVPRDFI